MENINIMDVKGIYKEIKKIMEENKDYLIGLDAAMGDGDLGLTMVDGFTAIVCEMENIENRDIGSFIGKMGMVMANTVPSTMGTLIATAMMKGGKAIKECEEISLKEIVIMGHAAIDGIKMRGKAEVGDKTILDSLYPAVLALEKASIEGLNMEESFCKAVEAAEEGLIKTKALKSKFGRAAYYGEKSIGHEDPGSAAGMLIIKAIYNYFK